MKTKETFLTIDPPSGWKYGFPKAVTQEQYKEIKNLKQWCIDNGYPKSEADSYGDYFHIQINGDLSFMDEEKSTREQALAWWNNLSLATQQEITKRTRLAIDSPLIGVGLTGREIEEIWKKETQYDVENDPVLLKDMGYKPNQNSDSFTKERNSLKRIANASGLKPNQKPFSLEPEKNQIVDFEPKKNQKQFKQFDPELFKAYIDKFSDRDKSEAFGILFRALNPQYKKSNANYVANWLERGYK